ncbi:MAG TPA: crosslink repair DNA glycosylase YcaQ family protein [Gaiella sp.]|nr:crosslink repair DNA glycosylase YcaQ family protein [Gaiella sp.]
MTAPALSLAAVRRLAIAAQGYAPRHRTGTAREVERAVHRLSCVQLDSISTVERSHRIALGGRVGAFPRTAVSRLLGGGRLIEYWAHEACLLPADDWPLLRPAMQVGGRRWYGEVDRTHPHLREHVLDEIRDRGPLGSRHFDGAARQGEMWGWKPAKQMLELLWNHGELVVAGRQGFQRLYDLPERVLPAAVLGAATPPEPERLRDLALRAVRARGVLTESGIVEHWRLKGGVARIRDAVASLVADGLLDRHRVEDGGAPVLVPAGAPLEPAAPSAAVLLSPFDNLLWDRPFARRVLGFDHLIEVYKPAPQRLFGYYVLPLLWRDRIVGRADLKSERREGELVVKSFHRETGVRKSAALDEALDRALARLARTIGLESVRR